MVYLEKGVVPADEEYTIPMGVGNIVREGSDITIVAYSNMVPRAVIAAEELAKEGINVEIVDPRTLVPLDIDLISRSAKKTGRVMILGQAVYTAGYASHISHEISQNCFKELKQPIRILSAYDVPPPMSYPLEVENMPQPDKIARVVKEELAK